MTYRRLTESDLSLLLEFFCRLASTGQVTFQPHASDGSSVQGVLTSAVSLPFGALDSGVLAAYFLVSNGMTVNDAQRMKTTALDLSSVCSFAPAILPEYRGTGLAAIFLEWVEARLRENGTQCLILQGGVSASNLRAVAYYRKSGFRVACEFFRNTELNYMMYKLL